MRRLFGLVPLALAALGCTPTVGKTVTVAVNADVPDAVDLIVVRAFDGRGLVVERAAPVTRFPQRLALGDVDFRDLRVAALGRGTAATRAGGRFDDKGTLTLMLSAGNVDTDGDGVVDAIDDCPGVADPEQDNGRGSGAGDACAPVVAATPGPGDVDGVIPDMATAALPAAPDMAGAPPADMAPPPLCDRNRSAICESFEAATLDPALWATSIASGGSIALDSTHVYRGKQALKVHAGALASGSFAESSIVNKSVFPASDLFVRAFVFVPAGFPQNPAALVSVGQSASPYHSAGLQLDSGGLGTFDELAAPAVYKGVAGSVATNQWVCLEWEVKLAKAGAINVWVDGTLVTGLAAAQDLSSNPAVGELHLGIAAQAAANIAARDLWIDEVGVGATRIGCGT